MKLKMIPALLLVAVLLAVQVPRDTGTSEDILSGIPPEGLGSGQGPSPMATTVYPWPMQRYDAIHNALTQSPAPSADAVFWSNVTGFQEHSSPAIANGMVYIGAGTATGDYMFAFYQNNGTLAWKTPTDVPVNQGMGVTSSPAYDNGMVFFGGDKIYGLDANTGAIRWRVPTGNLNWGDGSPTVANGMVFIGGSDRKVYAIYQSNGTAKWTFQTLSSQPPDNSNYGLYSAPAIYNGYAYVAACDGYVYKIKIDQPGPVASYEFRSAQRRTMYGSLAVYNDTVYVGNGYYVSTSVNNRFLALRTSDLTLKWSFYPGLPTSFFSSPAVAYGKVFTGSIEGNLYALHPDGDGAGGGLVLWQYSIGQTWSSPAISDGKLFIGTKGGFLYSFDANQSGSPTYRWRYNTGGVVDSSPAISDSVVCVGTQGGGGQIICRGTPIGPPDTPPSVTAFEPGGTAGQTYTVGSVVQVRWKATDDKPLPANNVNVSYGSAGSWTPIASYTMNDGIESWDTSVVPPGTYYINVSAYDSKGQRSWDLGNFTFQVQPLPNFPPTVTVTQPSGGESWSGGTPINIAWDMSDTETPQPSLIVYLNYSSSAGDGPIVGPLTGLIPPFIYPWTLPLIDAADVVVSVDVIDQGGARGTDSSTQFEIDSTPPFVVATNPANGQQGVAINTDVVADWSEAMNTTATDSSFELLDMATWTPVSGVIAWFGNSFVFNPDFDLAGGTWYSANFSTGARDDSTPGNSLAAPYSWTFRTATASDTTPPEIMNASAAPSPQEVHFTVNITANVTDNFGVAVVTADITGPSGTFNLTMSRVGSSETFYIERSYDEIGTHLFTIWARDTSGYWNNSVPGQFEIVDTTRPTVGSPTILPPSPLVFQNTNVSSLVQDNYRLSGVWIDIAGISNSSMSFDTVSGRYYHARSYPTPGLVSFRISAVDTSGHWGARDGSFIVRERPPEITQVSALPPLQEVWQFVNISAVVTDDLGLWLVTLNVTSPDSTSVNVTMASAPGDVFYRVRASDQLGLHSFTIWAVDVDSNSNSSSGSFEIVDLTPPTLSHTPSGSVRVDSRVNLTVTANDNYLIGEVRVNYTDVGGSAHNETMSEWDHTYYSLETATQTSAGTVTYFFWAVDSSGNPARTIAYSVEVTETRPNPPTNLRVEADGREALSLQWDAPTTNVDGSPLTDLSGYIIYRMIASGGLRTQLDTQPVQTAHYMDGGLADDTTYYYVVRAVNSRGAMSGESNEAFGRTTRQPSPDYTWVMLAIIAVAVAAIVLFLLLWKRKKDNDEKKAESESVKEKGTAVKRRDKS